MLEFDKLDKTMIKTRSGVISVGDLARLFCDVLDGTEDYDIQSLTGMSEADCSRIAEVRSALKPFWLNQPGR